MQGTKVDIISDMKLEIAINEIVVKELQIIVNKYNKQVDREKEKEKKLFAYVDLQEAQEAFGYGDISEAEFKKIQDYFENRENEKSVKELYLNHIKHELKNEKRNLADLKNELQVLIAEGENRKELK